MYRTADGEEIFIVDGHVHFWDGSPDNQRNRYAEGWVECFYNYHKNLSPADHFRIAKLSLDPGASPENIGTGLRHLSAIPDEAVEAASGRSLKTKLLRQQHLALAQQLIESGTKGDLESAYSSIQQADIHIKAVLKDNPNDRDATKLMAVAVAKANEARKRESEAHPQNMTAFVKCETAVTNNLKAPSTAKFGSYSDSTINSSVDSQNSFGAMIRERFRCDVECSGVDRCAVTSLRFR